MTTATVTALEPTTVDRVSESDKRSLQEWELRARTQKRTEYEYDRALYDVKILDGDYKTVYLLGHSRQVNGGNQGGFEPCRSVSSSLKIRSRMNITASSMLVFTSFCSRSFQRLRRAVILIACAIVFCGCIGG